MSISATTKEKISERIDLLEKRKKKLLDRRKLCLDLQRISLRIISNHNQGCPMISREAKVFFTLEEGLDATDRTIRKIEERIVSLYKTYLNC